MADPKAHASSGPLSIVDPAWLHMEGPTNLMMVTGVLLFDEPVDEHRLRDTLDGLLLRHERFRQRVAEGHIPKRGPRWEPDPAFSLDAHLHRITLPAPHDDRALETLVGDLMSTPFDRRASVTMPRGEGDP
jgi:diacylglycerol O-acyltransferase / wax synthase